MTRSMTILATVLALAGYAGGAGAQPRLAPKFAVDPFWPKPLPNHWLLGSAIGVDVDSRGHVWIVHRPETLTEREARAGVLTPAGECCAAAPPVLEFDAAGTLVGSWGGPGEGYDWPMSNHGITVDGSGHVWIGGNGTDDAHILKFTRTGELVLQVGKPGANGGSRDVSNFGRVAKVALDEAANEAFVADGYLNRRVAVLDSGTGTMKRFWGANGGVPDDAELAPYDPAAPPAAQFRNPVHCAEPSFDGFVYVCDRVNDRIQVFRKDGTYVRELTIARETRGGGSVWDIAFSPDPEQTYLYVADGGNERIWIVERATLAVLTSFGGGGRQPGQFFGVHSIAADADGNLYTTETFEGKRVQKFVYLGLAPVESAFTGVAWPESDR